MNNEKIKSTKIAGVDCKIGRNCRTPSEVSMFVSDNFVIEAVKLYDRTKIGGEKPKEGLIGLELHAVYAVDLEEGKEVKQVMEGMEKDLEGLEDGK